MFCAVVPFLFLFDYLKANNCIIKCGISLLFRFCSVRNEENRYRYTAIDGVWVWTDRFPGEIEKTKTLKFHRATFQQIESTGREKERTHIYVYIEEIRTNGTTK